jgi:hypothetical protein
MAVTLMAATPKMMLLSAPAMLKKARLIRKTALFM